MASSAIFAAVLQGQILMGWPILRSELIYRSRRNVPDRGFSYLQLLVVIASLAASAAHSVSMGRQMSRRDAESALLDVGDEFRRALAAYAAGARSDTDQLPRSLDELQRDPRVAGVARHLRRIRADPLTGKVDWGLIRRVDGAIVGVYSLAKGQPIKREGFDPQHRGFERAQSYAAWIFSPWPDQVAQYRR